MTETEIRSLLKKQQDFYKSGKTIPVKFRTEQLRKLYNTIKKYETEICDAIKTDLGKSNYESFMCEVGLSLTETSYMIRHVKRFAKSKTVPTPLPQFAFYLAKDMFLMNMRSEIL